MFERFTDSSRRVVVLAQEEARLLDHDWIGTEHLLLALLREPGLAAEVLAGAGLGLEETREEVRALVGRGSSRPSGHIPFTPRAKGVLEGALRHALRLGQNRITSGHILRGLLDDSEAVAAQILERRGPTFNSQLASEVERRLSVEEDEGPFTVQAFTVGGGVGSAAERIRKLVRRRGSESAEFGVSAELGAIAQSPAMRAVMAHAAALAGEHGRLSTLEMLRSLVADRGSAAARVLIDAGVDLDDLVERLAHASVEHTSDEPAEQAGARHITIDTEGDEAVIRIDDPSLVDKLKGLLEAGELTGLDRLWLALRALTESSSRVDTPPDQRDDEPPIDPDVT